MEKIQWSKTLSVDIAEIDEQHLQLIEIINNLIDATSHQKDSDIISALISKMAEYIDYHFGTEEKYMTRFKYSGLTRHRNEHRVFIRKVFDLRKQFARDETSLTDDMLTFLLDWLRHHISETDRAYSLCFRENGLQ